MTKKAYKGYKAFDYLTPGVDYPVYELAKWDWAGRYLVPIKSQAEEERVKSLVEKNVVIATHEHPCYFPKDMNESRHYHNAGREFCAYDALAESYIDCVFDNMMDGSCNITSKSGWKWTDVIHDLGMRLCDLHQQDFLIQCKNVSDIHRAKKEGKIAWVPVLECATPIENELDRIDVLYGFGVRVMGITYSESNALGNGLKEDTDGGLTKFGKEAVKRMNKVGMLIDVSHCGHKTAQDTAIASEKPILMTHVGAKKLWNSKRLFEDYVMKEVADRGGVVCVESAPHTTMTKTHNTHDIDSVMEHFEYIANLRALSTPPLALIPCMATMSACITPMRQACRSRIRATMRLITKKCPMCGFGEPHRGLHQHRPLACRTRLQRCGYRQGGGRKRPARTGQGMGEIS